MLRIDFPKSDPSSDSPDIALEELIKRVNECLEKDDLAVAYPLLEELANRRPDDCRTQVIAGLVALNLDRLTNAAHHFESAVQYNQEDFDANYNLALLNLLNSRPGDALSKLRHLRRLHPENTTLLNDIGVIWSDGGNFGRAMGAFSRAMRLDPNDSRARNNAMQCSLEYNAVPTALKLLRRQEEASGLNTRSRTEIQRWKQVFEHGCTGDTENHSPENNSKVTAEQTTGGA